MADVLMPKLSDTMEEGKVLRWVKRVGDRVEVGDVLVEVETDKADMEVETTEAGVLREIRLEEGASAPVGAVIAVIEEEGSADAAARPAPAEGGSAAAARPAEGEARPRSEPAEGAPGPPAQARPASASVPPGPPSPAARSATSSAEETVKVSPLARSLAAELGVDPSKLRGTGPGGRVVRRDVEAAAKARGDSGPGAAGPPGETAAAKPVRRPPPGAAPAAALRPRAPAAAHRIPLSAMRASIARRMAESKREAPHFYLSVSVDMEQAAALREAMKASSGPAAAVTINHMIVKAAADALRAFPEVNARFAGDAVELLEEVNVGIATAVPDGLVVPVVHHADRLSLVEIAAAARALAERARARSFSGDDLSGGTFTVSNLGMYGVESFVAVINPPQAAVLAVGTVAPRPVVREGALVARRTVSLTLSCDHRALDGARAGEFLRDLRERLENPMRLLFPPA